VVVRCRPSHGSLQGIIETLVEISKGLRTAGGRGFAGILDQPKEARNAQGKKNRFRRAVVGRTNHF
jgi:hypothetical protein